MSTPTKDTVNAAALAAQLALKTAANTAFIANADIVIAQVEANGKFSVELPIIRPARCQISLLIIEIWDMGFATMHVATGA